VRFRPWLLPGLTGSFGVRHFECRFGMAVVVLEQRPAYNKAVGGLPPSPRSRCAGRLESAPARSIMNQASLPEPDGLDVRVAATLAGGRLAFRQAGGNAELLFRASNFNGR
jgi:hypothetical protein